MEEVEVFQEAMEPKDHLDDQEVKDNHGDAVVDKGDDAATVNASPLTVLDEAPSAAQNTDKFEESIGVAEESAQDNEKVELVASDEVGKVGQEPPDSVHLDGVDSGGTGREVSCDESSNIIDDGLQRSELNGAQEQSDLNTDEVTVAQENGAMVDVDSGLVSEKSEDEDSGFVTPRENGGVIWENRSTEKVDDVVPEPNTESEFNKMSNQDFDAGDLKESNFDPEFRGNNTKEQLNASAMPYSETQDHAGEEVHENSALRNSELPEEVITDLKDNTLDIDINNEGTAGDEISSSFGQSTKCKDYNNDDANDSKAGSDSEDQEAVGEIGGTSPDIHDAMEDRELIQATGSSSSLQNSTADEIPVQITAADLKGLKDDQSQVSAVDNHGDQGLSSVAGEHEKIQENNAKEKETTQATRDQNSEVSSSSGNPVAASNPPVRPAGLGRTAPLLEPTPRTVPQPRTNGTVSNTQSRQTEDSSNGETEEYDETREKLQMIRVKFLRLAHRLGQTPHNVVVAQVLYRLGLAEQLRGRNGGRVGAFSFDRASAMAEQLEAAGQEPLDFSCTIMVLGKTGVGKSATINSIFDEVKFNTDAFQNGTKKVQDVVGTVQGIKVRVIDTPGLSPSWSDQRHNEKILHSVKRFINKTPPDIVLYLDRLDMQSRDFSDMPLLRTITEMFGPSIWFNAIVVLTHAASAPPDGPNGTASSYDMFVTQRNHVVQQAIRQAAGDMRLMNPVALVENHSACRINRAGQRVLPNGQIWKPHLLLLSFASKILAEANAFLKLQDSPPGKPYTARARAPPLPFLLSSLLQSRPQLKLPEEQFGDEDSLDDDLDESSDSDDETEPDDLPPFKRLTKAQVGQLSRAQKKAYFDELEYREKFFMKKQLKEEKKQRRMLKKMAESTKELPSDPNENVEDESGGAASVPVPMPDLALPASFDSDNPTHRYRYLDSSNQWLVRPVLETHGWDHDVGYEGLNVERLFVLKEKMPLSFTGQVTKDKKDANVQMEVATSLKYGEGKSTSLGFDMQTVGKDLAYTLRSETKFSNFRRNMATAGLSFTLLGDALSAGVKVEDKFVASKRFKVVIAGGAMAGRGDVAYGGSLEAHLRDKDYPLGRSLSTLGLSVMDWHGDLAVGCNVQSQIPVGRYTNLVARANLNNRGAGQVSIRLNSSEQLQIALIGLIPLLKKMVGYPQQLQFGQ
ncbi:hypothetical protein S245_040090 [Arachis hypogaea]|uniref:AIG1-type G domain-containing protein n=1 Tax=Arachis hypogaea TaxID=3818 RepID=A0A445AGV1_ARAHY|nr:Translocase of chloroplast [Arachis hypogaea]QHO23784.1 Translocase of chloroplast [Arachis hypogaea]QHO23785.1 Translocase of chloroplast [Arachis hypogaea]RYR25614.1 hypothetical protein Ahy_B02g059432 [Arachis hypogaea]